MHIRVINPNTTASMTAKIGAAATAVAAPGTEIRAVNPAMGPASIEGYYDEALSIPGLLMEAARAEREGADGIVIACFDDVGLDAVRSLVSIPVVGLCEAALLFAGRLGPTISVITTLDRSVPALKELARRYGQGEHARVHASGVAVLELEEEGGTARARLETVISHVIRLDRPDSLVLGCAGMADLARALSKSFGLPVVDGVSAAVKLVESLVTLGLSTAKSGAYAAPADKVYRGALSGFAPAELLPVPAVD